MKKQPKSTGELGLIEQIQRTFVTTTKAIALGIGDDCAILRPPPGCDVMVTTDFSLENRHFRRDTHSPESVGHRCLARGLSDLAAMGATPLAAFLSLALPGNMLATAKGRFWVTRFFSGMRALSELHRVPLAGGDTSESPGLGSRGSDRALIVADIVLLGSAPKGKALRRSGASAGDSLYVTGQLGGAAAELATVLKRKRVSTAAAAENHPHLFPEPRLDAGEALLRRELATACLDISDGLSSDLAHLCRASGVCAEIEQSALPIHPLALKLGSEAAQRAALHGGEDYELLFASSAPMPNSIAGVPVTRIGTLLPRRTGRPLISLLRPDGTRTEVEARGWEHFAKPATRSRRKRPH